MLDVDQFEERAALVEFGGGLSRFEAETLAAEEQGYNRWEAMNEIRKRNSGQARHTAAPGHRNATHDMPGVQPAPAQENRPMPERDNQAGRGGVGMLALRMERG